jgi:hypothetical protein
LGRSKKIDLERAAAAGAAAAVAAQAGDPALELEPDGEEADLLRALRELEGAEEIQWTVHKLSGPLDERGFIEKLGSSQLDLQRFRDVYGPGEYRLTGFRNGLYVKGGHKVVKISAVAYKRADAPAAPARGDSAAEIIAALDARQREKNTEWKSWAQVLVPVLGPPLIAAVFGKKDSVKDLVEGLAALQGLQPERKDPEPFEAQLDRMTGALTKLKELAGDDKSAGSTWVDLVRDAIQAAGPAVSGLATQLAMRRAAAMRGPPMTAAALPDAPPPAIAAPLSANGSAAPPFGAPGNGESMQLIPWLRSLVELLLVKAAQDKDPALYAEVTYDDIPDGVNPADLRAFIEKADWWTQLLAFDPRLQPYQGWMARYREELLTIFREASAPARASNEEVPLTAADPDADA